MLAWMLLATIPMDGHIVRETVDCIEVNAVYDGEGCQTFKQVVGWDWRCDHHEVAGWRMMSDKTWRPPNVTWVEGQRLHILRGKYWRETHYQWDEEIAQRELFPKCFRRGLFGVRE